MKFHRIDQQDTRLSHPARRGPTFRSAFTLIEIALSLAVIAFALIAIIGVLPFGLTVQKDNRQETIINQDAAYLTDIIRSGAQGVDDLTNYIQVITQRISDNTGVLRTNLYFNPRIPMSFSVASDKQFPLLTNGFNIVGLLSIPRYYNSADGTRYQTNTVTAYVQAISGNASEKPPQYNKSVRDLAFTYRVNVEVSQYESAGAGNGDSSVTNLQKNLGEIRLMFRWPIFPNASTGNGRLTFRTQMAGNLEPDFRFNPALNPPNPLEPILFFLQPGAFLPATNGLALWK